MCDTIYTFECDLEKCEFKASIGAVACESCLENGNCEFCTNRIGCGLKLNCITNKCRMPKWQISKSRVTGDYDDLLTNHSDISG